MKKIKWIPLFLLAAFVMASCGTRSDKMAEVMERLDAGEIPEEVDVFALDLTKSRVAWEGTKVGGAHDGTIGLAHGELYVFEGNLLAGNVIMDMNDLVVLDIENPESNARLVGHLKSDDFFSVDTYPEAEFEIVRFVSIPEAREGEPNYTVFGNLTIKGITHGISFDAILEHQENRITAFADFDLDRTRWDVRFGSGRFFDNLGDNLIHDNFNLKLDIVAQK